MNVGFVGFYDAEANRAIAALPQVERSRTYVSFDTFILDDDTRQLTRGGQVVHLTPKAFDLIHVLAAEAPRVVSKSEVHQRLWPDTFVSDASLAGLIKELRRALDDTNPDAPVIRTVHRVGYACGLEVRSAPTVRPHAWHWLVLQGRRVPLAEGANVIGRDPEADVWLDATRVSRRHARIVIENDEVRLEDLESKNGTTVEGSSVRGAIALKDGDHITFGSTACLYRRSPAGISTATRPSALARPERDGR
jgi:DNA-binding winged helix-turn-helix (wHTH) protein